MPAAAVVVSKEEKINGCVGSLGSNDLKTPSNGASQDPAKIANTIIEKKIRNLEKRKARLLEIKNLEDKGNQLEQDQVVAVKKLDGVSEMIDILKEINKNVTDSLNENTKQQKKHLKKEQQDRISERTQFELDRFKFMIQIQNILLKIFSKNLSLKNESANNLNLEEKHIDALNNLACNSIDREEIDNYAEKMQLILDGSKKESLNGVSCLEMKGILTKLIENYNTGKEETLQSQISSKIEPIASNKLQVDESATDSKFTVANVEDLSQNQLPRSTEELVSKESIEVDLQKDPAIVASGYGYPSFSSSNDQSNVTNCPINFLLPSSTNGSGMEFPLIFSTVSVGSIPTQTFTNQNYSGFIPNKIPVFGSSKVSSNPIEYVDNNTKDGDKKSTSLSNQAEKDQSQTKIVINETNDISSLSESNFQEKFNGEWTSQENNPSSNQDTIPDHGTKRSNNYRNPNFSRRGNPRGQQSNVFRGRSPKNFGGYFNSQTSQQQLKQQLSNPAQPNSNFQRISKFNSNRPINRQNGAPGIPNGGFRGNNSFRSNDKSSNTGRKNFNNQNSSQDSNSSLNEFKQKNQSQ
ncbi:Skt5p [Sarcoptes scabiei]|nr:Skt5p [Sarcoptes scabiei]